MTETIPTEPKPTSCLDVLLLDLLEEDVIISNNFPLSQVEVIQRAYDHEDMQVLLWLSGQSSLVAEPILRLARRWIDNVWLYRQMLKRQIV